MTYLKAVRAGMKVLVGAEVVSVGGRMAVVRGWMGEVDEESEIVGERGRAGIKGGLLAACEHGKVNTDPPVERRDGGRKSKL